MILLFGILILSIALLYIGAEFALNASEKIGMKLGMSPLLVGMLLVGFGTSLPELFVSHLAAFENAPDIAYGGLIGSNIANLLLILGVTALICKLRVSEKNLRPHIVLHSALAAVLLFVVSRQYLDFVAILPLLVIIVIYMYYLLADMKSDNEQVSEEVSDSNFKLVGMLLIGFGFLFLGGKFLIDSVVGICALFNVNQLVVSAIVIALGTSFPELVTALVAAKKKKDTDIIVGNIIGSNIFNCGLILSSLVFYNFKMNKSLFNDVVLYNIGASILLLLMLKRSYLGKFVGIVFLGIYAYTVYYWMGLA